MTEPTAQKLTELAREFMDKFRAHINQSVAEEPELTIERIASFGALLAAATMMLLRVDKRNQAIVAAALQFALRRVGKGVIGHG